MSKFLINILIIFFYSSLLYAEKQNYCNKIISFAPSISLVLEKLNLTKNVVGRTSFDNLKSIKDTQIVGDLFQPNIELIFRINPSIVFLLESHRLHASKLDELNVKYKILAHNTIVGILNSISIIGKTCSTELASKEIISKIKTEQQTLKNKYKNKIQKKVMIIIGNSINQNEIYISGNDGFYSELLKIVNARNIYNKKTTAKLSLTKEGFNSFKPDNVFFISPDYKNNKTCHNSKKIFSEKYNFKINNISCFSSKLALIPSPSYIQLASKFAKILHQL